MERQEGGGQETKSSSARDVGRRRWRLLPSPLLARALAVRERCGGRSNTGAMDTGEQSILSPRRDEQQKVVAIISSEDLSASAGDLEFKKGDVIGIRKRDGTGWAEGELCDGTVGWFSLEAVESVDGEESSAPSTSVQAEAPEQHPSDDSATSGSSLLEPDAGVDSSSLLQPRQRKKRQDSLLCLLESRPVMETLVQKNILPNVAVENAQKRLMKEMKRNKEKERERYLIDRVASHQSRKRESSNQLVASMNEDLFDTIVLTLLDIPRQKFKSSLFQSGTAISEEVVSGRVYVTDDRIGSQILDHLQENETCIAKLGLSEAQAKFFGQILVDRNVIVDNTGNKTSFKSKSQYAIQCLQTQYSIINVDKFWEGAVRSAYDVSVELMHDMVHLMQTHVPDFESLRKSRELRRFGLRLAELQKVSFHNISKERKKIVNINLYNMMVLYTHAKFNPPITVRGGVAPTQRNQEADQRGGGAGGYIVLNTKQMVDRKFAHENIQILANNLAYSLQSLEMRAVKEGKGKDPLIYFCLSDCTKASPGSYLFTDENFEETQRLAARRFLMDTVRLDEDNYEITLPRLCQKIWKDLKIEKAELIPIVKPLLSETQRAAIDRIQQVGELSIRFSGSNFTPSYVFERA